MSSGRDGTAHVLLVDDNPGDTRLLTEALRDRRIRSQIHIVGNAREALDFLRHRGDQAAAPRPNLILLDLNLPGQNGSELLAELKEDAELRRIPVVVLTASTNVADVRRSYDLHANCYVTKPLKLEDFLRVVWAVEDFWLNVATLVP
jgi:CheY-like chemotaxis protein